MLMSCASLHHTKNPQIDMLKLAGRRPAMNQTHCAAMLKQNHLCVLLSRAALCGARNAEIDGFEIAGRVLLTNDHRHPCNSEICYAKVSLKTPYNAQQLIVTLP